MRNGLNASDSPEESNHIPSILCAPEIMLLGLTYNANTIRLKPVRILRFPLTGSAAAIDSIVDLLLADTVLSLLLEENNLSSHSEAPLLVPLCYSILYFLPLGGLVQYQGLSIPHMLTTLIFPSSAQASLFNNNFIYTNACLISPLKGSTSIWKSTFSSIRNWIFLIFLSSLYLFTHSHPICGTLKKWPQFFVIPPRKKYGPGSFPFNLAGVGDCFYQPSTYRSEALWFLRWGHKRLHNFCLVLLEHPPLCMFALGVLHLQPWSFWNLA